MLALEGNESELKGEADDQLTTVVFVEVFGDGVGDPVGHFGVSGFDGFAKLTRFGASSAFEWDFNTGGIEETGFAARETFSAEERNDFQSHVAVDVGVHRGCRTDRASVFELRIAELSEPRNSPRRNKRNILREFLYARRNYVATQTLFDCGRAALGGSPRIRTALRPPRHPSSNPFEVRRAAETTAPQAIARKVV